MKLRYNNKGRASGLLLILLLIVAIIVAYLAATQMSSLDFGKKQQQSRETPIQQAQDAVNAINNQQNMAQEALKGFD